MSIWHDPVQVPANPPAWKWMTTRSYGNVLPPSKSEPEGVWFVYENDYTPDWVGLYLDELEARRKADEYTWGRVKFVEFGEVNL